MPISSVGRASNTQAGVTLIEMLVVMTIMAILIGVTFPAITSGIDTLRLNAACNGVVSFFNSGLSRAERRQQVVEVTISKSGNSLTLRSTDAAYTRTFGIPDGVSITKILPELSEETGAPRVFMLYPGGTVPAFGVWLTNRKHTDRVVQVDPMTGVAVVGQPQS